MRAAPTRLDALEKRIAEMEAKFGGKWPADVCRRCGERAARLTNSIVDEKGIVREWWECAKCEGSEQKSFKPTAR